MPNFLYTGFYDLLVDSVYQYKLSTEQENPYLNNRHARASISASMLLIECAANCFLRSLELPSKLIDELDKLQPLAKVDIFLKWSNVEMLDRGRVEVQKVAEIIRARNDFVHTKEAKIPTEFQDFEQAEELWKLPMTLISKQWIALGLPKNSMFWSPDGAFSVLEAVTNFLRYVCCELLKLEPDDASIILASHIEVNNVRIQALYEEFKTELIEAKTAGIDLSFLGINNDVKQPLQ